MPQIRDFKGQLLDTPADLSLQAFLRDAQPSLREPLAAFHDCVVMPLRWILSPRFRARQRYVLAQNLHLDEHAAPAKRTSECGFCAALPAR